MGTGPFKFVEHVKGSHWVGKKNPDYWDKGKPYLDGYRAIFISASVGPGGGRSAASGPTSSSAASARAERDSLVQALGPQDHGAGEPVGLRPDLVAMQPREEAVRRQAGAPGAHAGARPLRGLEGPVEDRDREGGGRHPGAGHAVRDAARRAGEAGRLRPRHQRQSRAEARRLLQGGRRRGLLVHLQEPRHPACPTSRSASGSSTSGGRSGSTSSRRSSRPSAYSPDAQAGRLRGGDGLPVRLHRRARPRPLPRFHAATRTPTTASYNDRCSTTCIRSRRGPPTPRSGRRPARIREAAARRGGPLHLHAPVAPDHPAQRQGQGLDDHAEPLPEQPARHGLAQRSKKRRRRSGPAGRRPRLPQMWKYILKRFCADDPHPPRGGGADLRPDARRSRRHGRAAARGRPRIGLRRDARTPSAPSSAWTSRSGGSSSTWMAGAARLDFGTSMWTGSPI